MKEVVNLNWLDNMGFEADVKGMFIITGSHQAQLHSAVSQSLAGRTAILKLLPLLNCNLYHFE